MSLNFSPDSSTQLNGTWDATFLSDRDVSAQVPINFVPHPGVYVTAACFGDNVYESDAAKTCLSNLLSSQIRRYVIDLYWDTSNHRFGLCPVEIPRTSKNTSAVARSSVDTTSIEARQVTPSYVANSTSSTTSSGTTTIPATATYSVISSSDGSRFLQLGPYQCSDTLTLDSITSVFSDYLQRTSNTLEAKIQLWILHLHVASPWDQPDLLRTELSSAQLPNASQTVGTYLDNLEQVLYTPSILIDDRLNLNSSWFRRGDKDELPLTTYMSTYTLPNGDVATEDGWPDENYIQVVRGKRMLIGFGDIDSGLSEYNTSADGDQIYPPNYIDSPQDIQLRADGQLVAGCYYNGSVFDINQMNNSWATAAINTIDAPPLGDAADNLTTCGFSQMLNVTVNGIAANDVAGPYQDFGNNAVFGWAYGEPQNDTSRKVDEDQKFRCALMVSTDAYRGHWRTDFCNDRYRVACREAGEPYRWRISGYTVPFGSGEASCTGNSTFDVPRTGLELTYLYNKILADAKDDRELLNGVWVNFNSLAVDGCWVTTGVNGTCPYYQNSSATESRQILIPSLAALIVLILTGLTILVKCTSNARNNKMKRRGEGGWDYEGVPS